VKILLLAALASLTYVPPADAAGWRACKPSATPCRVAKPALNNRARASAYRQAHDTRRMGTREFYYRLMLSQ
jgi:hypothetical protein